MTGTEGELKEGSASPSTTPSQSPSPSPPPKSFRPPAVQGQPKQPLKPGHIIVQRVASPQQQAQRSLNPAPPRPQAPGVHLVTSSHPALLRPAPPAAPSSAPRPAPVPAEPSQRSTLLNRMPAIQPLSSVHASPGHVSGRYMACAMTLQPSIECGEVKPPLLVTTQVFTPLSSSALAANFEASHRDRSADIAVVVNISDRKVKLTSETDQTSLYALSRRWLRNDMPRKDQPGFWDCMVHLPRPLSQAEAERNEAETTDTGRDVEDQILSEVSIEGPADKLTKHDLLASHIKRFQIIRKRARKDQIHRIARYRHRLAFLLPPNSDPPRQVAVTSLQQHS